MQFAKHIRVRSKAHLDFVRSHPCLAAGCWAEPVVAHHISDKATAAMGRKSSDHLTVPFCDDHHKLGHTVGWVTFERKLGLDLRKEALWLARRSPDMKVKEAVGDD